MDNVKRKKGAIKIAQNTMRTVVRIIKTTEQKQINNIRHATLK